MRGEERGWCISKIIFPNFPPAQGHASPSRKLVLPQINRNYIIRVIYIYRLLIFYFIFHGAKINQSVNLW